MTLNFSLSDVYDKNVSFLIGSGASFGLFPTLALGVKDQNGEKTTVETLATCLVGGRENPQYTALFMHYYKQCIEPVLTVDYAAAAGDGVKAAVLDNYTKFLRTILFMLGRKKSGDKKVCNVFTTNYDGCLAFAAEELLRDGSNEFHINDGTQGFKRRFLDARNFNTVLTQTGVFGRHRNDVPQINLIQLHGSAYWYKDEQRIQVSYSQGNDSRLLENAGFAKCAAFSAALQDANSTVANLPNVDFEAEEVSEFWGRYDALPIVNPTKWKFHETVFEEHYYQMLRYLSYELEQSNSVLITFGFSFADEHIKNLIKRSLSNPTLQVFVCCFNKADAEFIDFEFSQFPNVQPVLLDDVMDFSAFNAQVFAVSPQAQPKDSAAQLEAE